MAIFPAGVSSSRRLEPRTEGRPEHGLSFRVLVPVANDLAGATPELRLQNPVSDEAGDSVRHSARVEVY